MMLIMMVMIMMTMTLVMSDDYDAGDDVDNHPPRNGLRWQKEKEPSHDDKQARGQVGLEGQIISKLFLESEGRSGRSNYL